MAARLAPSLSLLAKRQTLVADVSSNEHKQKIMEENIFCINYDKMAKMFFLNN